jgi:hypothetical protein
MEKINQQNNLYEQFLKYSYWDLKGQKQKKNKYR